MGRGGGGGGRLLYGGDIALTWVGITSGVWAGGASATCEQLLEELPAWEDLQAFRSSGGRWRQHLQPNN